MDENENEETPRRLPSPLQVEHSDCTRCPIPAVTTTPFLTSQKRVVDAIGDLRVFMTRDPSDITLWDVAVEVHDAPTARGSVPTIEHFSVVGLPPFMPKGCPEWLWMIYTAIGDMCTHFLDDHDDTGQWSPDHHYDLPADRG